MSHACWVPVIDSHHLLIIGGDVPDIWLHDLAMFLLDNFFDQSSSSGFIPERVFHTTLLFCLVSAACHRPAS